MAPLVDCVKEMHPVAVKGLEAPVSHRFSVVFAQTFGPNKIFGAALESSYKRFDFAIDNQFELRCREHLPGNSYVCRDDRAPGRHSFDHREWGSFLFTGSAEV